MSVNHSQDIPEAQLEQCYTPANINGLTLKNRFIKASTFENMTPEGRPTQRLKDFHGEIADGGVAMTTIAYCAVNKDGRVKEGMMYMGEYIRKELTDLIDDLHKRGTKVSGQMGHGGGFSQSKELSTKRPKGPSFGLNALGIVNGRFFCDPMTRKDIDNFVQTYRDAAVFMKSVGFDALEIHFGHGYGLCQFISPLTNRRKDEYGGSLVNRMRLPLRVLAAVRKAVGSNFPLLAKISLTEAFPGGLNYDDAIEISKMLDDGGIDAIITSGGSSSLNPQFMFKGPSLLPALLKFEKNKIMRLILRLASPIMFRASEYNELYFLEQASRVKDAVKCKIIYVGGASTSKSFAKLMDSGFDFIQLGRSLIAQPDLVNKAKSNLKFKSKCIHCNECVGSIEYEGGVYCPLFNPK